MCVFKTFKTLALVATSVVALSTSAMANDMIDNQASGVVEGSIYQMGGEDAVMRAEVGSVIANEARDNRAFGHVRGDIMQDNYRDRGAKLVAQVGTIRAKEAYMNQAEGWVDGDIIQGAFGDGVTLDARVGSIDAGKGVAFNNYAFGAVEGSIYQEAGSRSKLSARVGSIGPKN